MYYVIGQAGHRTSLAVVAYRDGERRRGSNGEEAEERKQRRRSGGEGGRRRKEKKERRGGTDENHPTSTLTVGKEDEKENEGRQKETKRQTIQQREGKVSRK